MAARSQYVVWMIHALACLLFLSFPVISSPDWDFSFRVFGVPPFQRDFLAYILLLLFFYTNYLFFLPRIYFHKKYFFYGVLVLAFYLLVTFLPIFIVPFSFPSSFRFPHPPPMDNYPWVRLVTGHLFQFLLLLVFSVTLRVYMRWRSVENERSESELQLLKAQINPHFLFNTLNSIYAMSLTKSDHTPKAVVKLSGMMRYVIYESEQSFVELDKEITYIRSYIDLQKFRLEDTVQLHFLIKGDTANKKIAPMLLVSFVENAFKYGVNPEVKSPISIILHISDTHIEMEVKNRKVNMSKYDERASGVGLVNVKHRLELLYPGAYELRKEEDDSSFYIYLKIRLV